MTEYYNTITDSGKNGKNFEAGIKGVLNRKPVCSKAGKVDLRKVKNFEVKTAAGELGNITDKKLVSGCSMVIYCPVVEPTKTIFEQEAFVLSRETFLDVLESVGLIREKISSQGVKKITIQTFWNNSKNKPHGKKYYDLIDALYDNCDCMLDELLEKWLDK